MSLTKQTFGQWREPPTADSLGAKGYQLLDTNVRTEHDEIDILAQSSQDLIAVEVKTGSSTLLDFPEKASTKRKRSI